MSIARHVALVGAATLASRVLGFVRDVALAGLFGTGFRADAFVVAFQFSNLVRRLLTEGALNAALVPLYLRRRGEGGESDAAAFAGKVAGTVTLFLVAIASGLALLLGLAMIHLSAFRTPTAWVTTAVILAGTALVWPETAALLAQLGVLGLAVAGLTALGAWIGYGRIAGPAATVPISAIRHREASREAGSSNSPVVRPERISQISTDTAPVAASMPEVGP